MAPRVKKRTHQKQIRKIRVKVKRSFYTKQSRGRLIQTSLMRVRFWYRWDRVYNAVELFFQIRRGLKRKTNFKITMQWLGMSWDNPQERNHCGIRYLAGPAIDQPYKPECLSVTDWLNHWVMKLHHWSAERCHFLYVFQMKSPLVFHAWSSHILGFDLVLFMAGLQGPAL